METNKSKKKVIMTIIALNILMIIGLSLAYFATRKHPAAQSNLDVITGETDKLILTPGENINIKATMDNFSSTEGNLEGQTSARATLKTNDYNKTIDSNYSIYFRINTNEYKYTTQEGKTELLLQVYGPGSEELYPIKGYQQVTIGEGADAITGYDITEYNGTILIAEKYPISVDGSLQDPTVQDWVLKVKFINLDSDQSANADKTFDGEILIEQDRQDPIIEICGDKTMANCIGDNYNMDENLYYHTTLGTSNGAHDESVRYAGAQYKLSDEASNTYDTIYDTSETANGIIKFYCSRGASYSYVGKSCSTSSYTAYYYLGDDTETQYATKVAAIRAAAKQGLLVDNVENYVCYGVDTEECDENHLYRIIGVFKDFDNPEIKRVKLIKANYANTTELGTGQRSTNVETDNVETYYRGTEEAITNFYWSGSKETTKLSTWSESTLNTTAFKSKYIAYIKTKGTKWDTMIAEVTWKLGGAFTNDIASYHNFANAYNMEINHSGTVADTKLLPNDGKLEDKFKIGMMYASDYLFSYSPAYWETKTSALASYIDYSWLYTGHKELTMTRCNTSSAKQMFYVNSTGPLAAGNVYGDQYAVRPSFYLDQNIKIVSGRGTRSNPFRVSL